MTKQHRLQRLHFRQKRTRNNHGWIVTEQHKIPATKNYGSDENIDDGKAYDDHMKRPNESDNNSDGVISNEIATESDSDSEGEEVLSNDSLNKNESDSNSDDSVVK